MNKMKLNRISETTLLRLEQDGFMLRKIFYGPLGLVTRAEAEAFCKQLFDEGHATFSDEGFHDGRTCLAIYSKEQGPR
ncbi:hypothetical protein M2323_000746 [Rhodoblastus acidophilus]|uniref:hypothetical protein n=1 Tax=Rhodoblastus acidophilus TaxID=1074 RepID=UPI0022241CD8|nr:hypothetical protein [Rhodoblastus acidophilus]MCW2283107.1 hypothetical protein [Rhodoblastus acidophilus]MCW2331842.1 hypothetical protein [Rhodoblastus acidophilus]